MGLNGESGPGRLTATRDVTLLAVFADGRLDQFGIRDGTPLNYDAILSAGPDLVSARAGCAVYVFPRDAVKWQADGE